ncbi:MAG: hypothetical protein K0M40_01755 [Prolixibacteraceae bacterium]|nr:hypothetical protein [Prolixibacteraceae bacterium]
MLPCILLGKLAAPMTDGVNGNNPVNIGLGLGQYRKSEAYATDNIPNILFMDYLLYPPHWLNILRIQ